MDIRNQKTTPEISKAVEAAYRVFFEEMRFAKQQQWRVTNYLLVALGAIFGIGHALKDSNLVPWERWGLAVLAGGLVASGYLLHWHLHRYMKKLRLRVQRIEASFSPKDRQLLQVEEYKSPGLRSLPYTLMMISVISIAGLVVGYSALRPTLSLKIECAAAEAC